MGYLSYVLDCGFWEPRVIQIGGGGEWENDLRFDLGTDRYIKLQYQCVGAPPEFWGVVMDLPEVFPIECMPTVGMRAPN